MRTHRHIVAAFRLQVPTAAEGAIFRSPPPIDLPALLGRAVARCLVADRMRSASFGEARDVVTQRVLQRSDGALEWESPGRERSAHAL